jgi:RNA polymerase sigma factor (sigma-70 family)
MDSFPEMVGVQKECLDSAGFGNPEDLLIRSETIQRVGKALARLNERCRELVRDRYFSELSFLEIAEKTGIKENSLVVQLKRCLVRLLGILEGEGCHG